ncbi:MAG TPA: hypothetical protein VGF69_20580 [Thermoanaerobaculia bacterium]|jgi:hypothetical protein
MRPTFILAVILVAAPLMTLHAEEPAAKKCSRLIDEGKKLLILVQDDSTRAPELKQNIRSAFEVCRGDGVPAELVSRSYILWANDQPHDRRENRATILREGLERLERSEGLDSPAILQLLDHLASEYAAHGETRAEGRAMFERGLTIRRRSYGEFSEEAAIGVFYLGSVDQAVGSDALAEKRYREAAAIAAKACGDRRPCETLGWVLSTTATLIRNTPGRLTEAEALEERAAEASRDPQRKKKKR